jgi:hypothetical protein
MCDRWCYGQPIEVPLVNRRAIGSNAFIVRKSVSEVILIDERRRTRLPQAAILVEERFAMDADLKRTAKGTIEKILHLRDSL